jgi:AcrR family transcriptional regulator/predicted DNA-binding transcriptional regulator AlpA
MALVETEDLIDNHQLAEILGLKHVTSVSTYLDRYHDMPRPVVVCGKGRIRLWSRSAVVQWKTSRTPSRSPSDPSRDADAPPPSGTRERLIEAAIELFVTNGYADTTVQEIASRAGLSTGAIYANFDGKRELLERALESTATSAYDTLGWSGDGHPRTEAGRAELIELWTAAATDPAQAVHRLTLEAWVAAMHDDAAARTFFERVSTSDRYLRRVVREGRRNGELSSEIDARVLLTFGRLLIMGAIASKALGFPQPQRAQVRPILEAMWPAGEPRSRRG